MKSSIFALTCLATATIGGFVQAQTTYEDGPDGVRFRVTRSVVQRSIPTTEMQTREQKVYHPQVTTEYQTYQQTYLTPVTQYQWEPHLRYPLGILGTPYWTHELRPVTRWEARPATVQVPVAKTNWVEETRTTQVPVTTYRTVPEEYTQRVVDSVTPAATSVASRTPPVGGQQYQGDPPRSPSPWAASSSGTYR